MNILHSNKMYILSGPPGSGKSTFLKNNGIDDFHIISLDKIRKELFGTRFSKKNNELIEEIPQESNTDVGAIAKAMVRAKLKQKLTVFIDSTNSTDSFRSNWIRMAQEYGMDFEILLFDPDVCLANNQSKAHPVSEEVLNSFIDKYEYDSKFKCRKINLNEKYSLVQANQIKSEIKLLAVSDLHGMYEEFESFLIAQGFEIQDDVIVDQKENRKLLFMGDFVDRGPDSIKVLKLVKNSVNAGHFAILGNHEEKLINNYNSYKKEGHVMLFKKRSLAVCQTFVDFVKLKENEQKELIEFLNYLPHFYTQEDRAFVHAAIESFDPFTITKSEAIYGTRNESADLIYSQLVEEGVNTFKLVRSHILPNHEDDNITCVYADGEYAGNLIMYNPKTGVKIKHKSEFNYYDFVSSKKGLSNVINKLSNEGLINEKTSDDGLFKILKYSNKTFYKDLWDQDKHLLEFRGTVVDAGMNLITYPFTKLFEEEFIENSIAVEKLNGFLLNISLIEKNGSNDLLITTSFSFQNDHIEYAKELISLDLKSDLIRHLSELKEKTGIAHTLMFEVIHEKDPHIVGYSENELFLIGCRANKLFSNLFKEEELDLVAEKLNVNRPAWGILDEFNMEGIQHEGFILRKPDGTAYSKVKSPYYKSIKLFRALKENKVDLLFDNVQEFKKSIPVGFEYIADEIISQITREKFKELEGTDRVKFVRSLIK